MNPAAHCGDDHGAVARLRHAVRQAAGRAVTRNVLLFLSKDDAVAQSVGIGRKTEVQRRCSRRISHTCHTPPLLSDETTGTSSDHTKTKGN
jgi:hypothetical protein